MPYVSLSAKVAEFLSTLLLLSLNIYIYTYKMAGKKRRGQKTPNFSTTNPDVNNAKGKKLESYEDTLEPGSTDHRKSPPLSFTWREAHM
jgi:hypothetical protein